MSYQGVWMLPIFSTDNQLAGGCRSCSASSSSRMCQLCYTMPPLGVGWLTRWHGSASSILRMATRFLEPAKLGLPRPGQQHNTDAVSWSGGPRTDMFVSCQVRPGPPPFGSSAPSHVKMPRCQLSPESFTMGTFVLG